MLRTYINTIKLHIMRTICTAVVRPTASPSSPLSSSPPPSPLLPSPLFPSPQKQAPLLRLGGLAERFSSPSGSGRSPAAERQAYLVNFRLKISPLVAKNSKKNFVSQKVAKPWPDRRLRPCVPIIYIVQLQYQCLHTTTNIHPTNYSYKLYIRKMLNNKKRCRRGVPTSYAVGRVQFARPQSGFGLICSRQHGACAAGHRP